jgi:hypothetical protein
MTRVSSLVANQVNRDFDRLIIVCIVSVVKATNAPWDPKVVAVCVFLNLFLNRSYDGIEAHQPRRIVSGFGTITRPWCYSERNGCDSEQLWI